MAMRLRIVDSTWVALCAAEFPAEEGDVYLDDGQDHAIRVKLEADWRDEGYMFDLRRHGAKFLWSDVQEDLYVRSPSEKNGPFPCTSDVSQSHVNDQLVEKEAEA